MARTSTGNTDYLSLLGTTFEAFNSLNNAFSQADTMKSQAFALDAQNASILDNAMSRASAMRKAGERFMDEQRSSMAASGVVVGTGSSLDVAAEAYRSTQMRLQDNARASLMKRQRNLDRSAYLRKTAKKTETAGYIKAAGSILSGSFG